MITEKTETTVSFLCVQGNPRTEKQGTAHLKQCDSTTELLKYNKCMQKLGTSLHCTSTHSATRRIQGDEVLNF